MTRVFVTGGSGFIAAHVIDELLKANHSVVFSVRSDDKANKVLANHPNVSKDKLSYVLVHDIAQEDAFDEVIKSNPPFEAVIHTSSPFHFNTTDPQKDLIDPAIIGTTGILKAIKKSAPSVKRVVVTSSFAAIFDPSKGNRPGYTYNEKDWSPITIEQAVQNPSFGYRFSKTAAEKAAWEFVEKEKPGFTLSTLNPPLVLGPIHPNLQTLDNLNTSNQRIANLIAGKCKTEIPATGTFAFTDVRDLALGHVRAIEREAAQGKRFFFTSGHFSNEQIADILREKFPDLKDNLPAKGTQGGGFPEEGVYEVDNSRAREVLGIKFRVLQETIVDTVPTLKAIGA